MKLTHRFTALLLAVVMGLSLTACDSSQSSSNALSATPSEQSVQSPESSTAEDILTVSGDYALKSGKYMIGLSNSFYGNTWRKQMVSSPTEAAEEAKKKGYIPGYEAQNEDNTVNIQIAQINSFILKKVDTIYINAVSSIVPNDIIKKAMDQGIKIIVFDSIIDLDGVYTTDYDWASMDEKKTQYVMDKIGGKGNVIVVRGPSGVVPDVGIYQGTTNILKKYPDVKIATEIQGQADATATQQGILNVLPSLPKVDAVITHCGADSMSVINAFQPMGQEAPLTVGDNIAEFMTWWNQQVQKGYETMSVNSMPSCSVSVLWTAVAALNNVKVPQRMYLPLIYINRDEIGQYADLQAGTAASPYMSYDYVVENILKK